MTFADSISKDVKRRGGPQRKTHNRFFMETNDPPAPATELPGVKTWQPTYSNGYVDYMNGIRSDQEYPSKG
jgi:hypothetical protein